MKYKYFIMFMLLVSCNQYMEEPVIMLAGQSNAKRSLADEIEYSSGHNVMQINHPGAEIYLWYDPETMFIYDDVGETGGEELDYFIWFQGESDHYRYDDYMYYLNMIINDMNVKGKVIIIGIYHGGRIDEYKSFREYQVNMCIENGWLYIDSADCERGSDLLHLTNYGEKQLAGKIKEEIR